MKYIDADKLKSIIKSQIKERKEWMKVPDKIHLGILDMGSGYVYNMSLDDNGEQEYIRKDALLEKLEKVAAEYKKRSDKGELVWQHMCGIKEAIGILNKM